MWQRFLDSKRDYPDYLFMISVVISQNMKLHPSIHSVFGAAQRMQSLVRRYDTKLWRHWIRCRDVSSISNDMKTNIHYKSIQGDSAIPHVSQNCVYIYAVTDLCIAELTGINTVYMYWHVSYTLTMFNYAFMTHLHAVHVAHLPRAGALNNKWQKPSKLAAKNRPEPGNVMRVTGHKLLESSWKALGKKFIAVPQYE